VRDARSVGGGVACALRITACTNIPAHAAMHTAIDRFMRR